jgi:primosomal protein N'
MKKMKAYFTKDTPIIAYGPFEAPIYKTQGKYKKRVIVKCKLTQKVRSIFGQIYSDFLKSNTKDTVSIDFNPSN